MAKEGLKNAGLFGGATPPGSGYASLGSVVPAGNLGLAAQRYHQQAQTSLASRLPPAPPTIRTAGSPGFVPQGRGIANFLGKNRSLIGAGGILGGAAYFAAPAISRALSSLRGAADPVNNALTGNKSGAVKKTAANWLEQGLQWGTGLLNKGLRAGGRGLGAVGRGLGNAAAAGAARVPPMAGAAAQGTAGLGQRAAQGLKGFAQRNPYTARTALGAAGLGAAGYLGPGGGAADLAWRTGLRSDPARDYVHNMQKLQGMRSAEFDSIDQLRQQYEDAFKRNDPGAPAMYDRLAKRWDNYSVPDQQNYGGGLFSPNAKTVTDRALAAANQLSSGRAYTPHWYSPLFGGYSDQQGYSDYVNKTLTEGGVERPPGLAPSMPNTLPAHLPSRFAMDPNEGSIFRRPAPNDPRTQAFRSYYNAAQAPLSPF